MITTALLRVSLKTQKRRKQVVDGVGCGCTGARRRKPSRKGSGQDRLWASAASAAELGLKNLGPQFFFLGSM
jgi:hypothetical protein